MTADLLDELLHRVLPVLVFLVGITVVAELSEVAGVFEVASSTAARWARGRVWVLWALVVLLATACTVVLSLDTTAVLLTPVVLTLASRLKVSTAAFAMTTVWLANTASLLLPVSNLTNLLSLHRMQQLGVGIGGYVRLTWLPALVAVLVTVLVLGVLFRRDLVGHYEIAPPRVPHDRVLLVTSATVCLLLGPAFVTGVNVAWPASGAALLLVVVFLWRDRSRLGWALLPWRAVVVVTVLFTIVFVLGRWGLSDLLAAASGVGEGFPAYLRLAGTAALAANVIDNLPAYLALEPAAGDSPARLVAVLIGVNCGPLLTFWASLATLLWRERCRARGIAVRWWVFALRGLLLVPLLLVCCTAALAVVA
ncbi:SLC13 family permease [Angustibacter sp. McL0619]|uniref:SLC13 family permease n=1 Tax=Angustibacter sp. McL0619 TaxID=3415676 RepID=UPI003CF37075